MNKILGEVSVGELLDKISILEIKSKKIKDPEKLIFINFSPKSEFFSHNLLSSSIVQSFKLISLSSLMLEHSCM